MLQKENTRSASALTLLLDPTTAKNHQGSCSGCSVARVHLPPRGRQGRMPLQQQQAFWLRLAVLLLLLSSVLTTDTMALAWGSAATMPFGPRNSPAREQCHYVSARFRPADAATRHEPRGSIGVVVLLHTAVSDDFHAENRDDQQGANATITTTTTAASFSSSLSHSFDETDAASKGVVASLTSAVNTAVALWEGVVGDSTMTPRKDDSNTNNHNKDDDDDDESTSATLTTTIPPTSAQFLSSPTSPDELRARIRDDYIVSNYLWTGDIDVACFRPDCRFQDPTLSFQGRDQFVTNVQNLRPILEALGGVSNAQSKLLDCQLTPDYVQTRWNMKGQLSGLFWKPQINVIGRTKFWYQQQQSHNTELDTRYQVYYYDEEWEMPAYQALLQLVTPQWGAAEETESL